LVGLYYGAKETPAIAFGVANTHGSIVTQAITSPPILVRRHEVPAQEKKKMAGEGNFFFCTTVSYAINVICFGLPLFLKAAGTNLDRQEPETQANRS
jgi:hypothetical protein